MGNSISDESTANPKENIQANSHTLSTGMKVVWIVFLMGLTTAYILSNCAMFQSGAERYPCRQIEIDANNTIAATAYYYAEEVLLPNRDSSGRVEIPTIEDLRKYQELIIHSNSSVTIDGSFDSQVRVTVIDKNDKCVLGQRYETYLGGNNIGQWYNE